MRRRHMYSATLSEGDFFGVYGEKVDGHLIPARETQISGFTSITCGLVQAAEQCDSLMKFGSELVLHRHSCLPPKPP